MAVNMSLNPGMRDWIRERVDFQRLDDPKWEKARNFLRGEGDLSVGQVEKLSKRVQIPFGYFFLETPPEENLPILQFRTVDNAFVKHPSRDLIDTVSFARNIQSCVYDMRKSQEFAQLSYVGAEEGAARAFLVDDAAARIRTALGLREDWSTRLGTAESALNKLRKAAQQIGIIVMIDSMVRHSTNRPLDVEEFRAFCFADEFAPLIFLNGNDTKGAQVFSLLHELVHIFVGQDDFFNLWDEAEPGYTPRREEVFCNAVAGELLAPRKFFVEEWDKLDGRLDERLRDLAAVFNGTVPAMLYRAVTYRLISQEESECFMRDWRMNYPPVLPKNAVSKGKKEDQRFDPVNQRIGRLGAPVIAAIADGIRSGRLSYAEALRLTGTTLDSFKKLVRKATGTRWTPELFSE